ncbi:MAG: transglycosylase SLT domain-containing protein [Betaproteobacteria bacterium]
MNLSAALALAWALFAAPAWAGREDDAVAGAYDAYRSGDAIRLARHARQLGEGHLMAPWIEYWRVSMRIEDAQLADVQAFFDRHNPTYAAERLRGEWLKVLGKRRDWESFDREASLYGREDLEIRCYAWLSRLQKGDDTVFAESDIMWLDPKEHAEGCAALTEALMQRGQLSVGDVWRRVRVLFSNGQISAAKSALGYLPTGQAPNEGLLQQAAREPKRVLDRLPKTVDKRPHREVIVLAALRQSRNDPEAVAALLDKRLGELLPEADARYLWGRVGYDGARQHHPSALRWFGRAGDTVLDDDQLAWRTRAGLRAGRWSVVRDSIDRMSPIARLDPAWSYWYGRALAAAGDTVGARAYWSRIAGDPHFYGVLAHEELGYTVALPEHVHQPTEQEVEHARTEPGLARALELIRLGVRMEGVREWLHTVRYMDDSRLIAAAEYARRQGIHDRSIQAADRTQRLHNFSLRYPRPFNEVFREYAKTHGVDEAWVLGLVRQESRFIVEARSSAGAAGLMQLMPATAKYVAAKVGLRGYQQNRVTDVKTNVMLGTGYLRMVLDQLGSPVLASAAYNAGPGRARRWRDVKPLEGAVYAETIPFGETRDYVKKVMANAVFYAALDKRSTPLKTLMGTIQPRSGTESAVDDDLP